MTKALLDAMVVIAENILRYGGILILVYAIIQFIMAVRDSDGPRHETARKFFIVAMISLVLSMFLAPFVSGAEALVTYIVNTLSNSIQ